LTNIEALEEKVKSLETQVKVMQDVAKIERLQRAYGYYVEHWMAQEIIDCFSDAPDVQISLSTGMFKGKARIRQYFEYMSQFGGPLFIHQLMQLSGIVDVSPDGKTAEGRWYGFGIAAIPIGKGVPERSIITGVYEMKYVKENEIWKIKSFEYAIITSLAPRNGWTFAELPKPLEADVVKNFNTMYPSGYIHPFHYKHPVTGK
jgi:hypothetical protein